MIHPDDIAWMHEQICEQSIELGLIGTLDLEKYQEGLPYLLVADVARGDGADSSVFHVIRTDTMEIVAEYQGKPTLDHYANILNDAGREYGNASWLLKT